MWFPFSYICRTEKYDYFQIFRYFSYRGCNIKMVKMAKYGHFEYVVEYPIWVSIKKTLTGKSAIDGQILIYCIRFEEIPKPSKTECFQNSDIFGGFWTFSFNQIELGTARPSFSIHSSFVQKLSLPFINCTVRKTTTKFISHLIA